MADAMDPIVTVLFFTRTVTYNFIKWSARTKYNEQNN